MFAERKSAQELFPAASGTFPLGKDVFLLLFPSLPNTPYRLILFPLRPFLSGRLQDEDGIVTFVAGDNRMFYEKANKPEAGDSK
jgi:hypothetical protein